MNHTNSEWEAIWHNEGIQRDDPGYWSIEAEILPGKVGTVLDSGNRHHCISPEEDRGNALLAAASRELLEAAEEALARLEDLEGGDGGRLSPETKKQLVAAIKKARGESQ
jgi:hypothetical protein